MEGSVVVQLAQKLASNQPKVREKALKKLGLWLERKSVAKDGLDEETMLKIWKGLFYYFWHCDKMLFQEDRAEVISKFIHIFKRGEYSFLYIDTFFQTMVKEWHGIDRYRIEKFMMLVRRVVHQSYQLLKNKRWKLKYIKHFFKILKKTVLSSDCKSAPYGLKIHVSDIYMEELAKVGSDELSPKQVRIFLIPYSEILCYCEDPSILSCVRKDIFLYLANQDADAATFHEFPLLKFNATTIQKMLLSYTNKPNVSRKNMKVIHSIIKEFEDYKNGITFGDKLFADKAPKRKLRKRAIERATLSLVEEEEELRKIKKAYRKTKGKNGMALDEDIEEC